MPSSEALCWGAWAVGRWPRGRVVASKHPPVGPGCLPLTPPSRSCARSVPGASVLPARTTAGLIPVLGSATGVTASAGWTGVDAQGQVGDRDSSRGEVAGAQCARLPAPTTRPWPPFELLHHVTPSAPAKEGRALWRPVGPSQRPLPSLSAVVPSRLSVCLLGARASQGRAPWGQLGLE